MGKFWDNRQWIYALIGVAIVLISGLYVWNVLSLKRVQDQMRQQLEQQARFASQLAARMFDGNVLETLGPGDETSPSVLYFQQLLWELTTETGVQDAVILTLDGHILIDSRTNFTIGDSLRRLPLDRQKWVQAINGATPQPDLVQLPDGYVLITYTPILNPVVGNPVAVLVMEYPTQFFHTVLYFKQQLVIQAIAGILVLILFSALIILSIRQLVRTERTLLEQQHLAELGQMSAMVAHEIRNPLSIIKGSADVLRRQYRSEDNELFDFIPQEIERLNRLVNNFLSFARKRRLELRPVELVPLIQQQLQLAGDERIALKGAADVRVLADEDALKQIVLNLLTNARKAIESRGETGKIEIEVTPENGGKYVWMIIRDNGIGMDAETLKKAFQPFFSNTATGSGLGLTITRQLVERMGGRIELESEPNAGTTVRIRLRGADGR